MERSNPESVERLRENGRSGYISAAHAASFARSVSARTFAEAMASNSRDIALPFRLRGANRATKNPGGGAYQGSDERKRGSASRSTRDAMRRRNTIHMQTSCSYARK